jgi:hypothetical protein
MTPTIDRLAPGVRVRISSRIDRRAGGWPSEVTGTVIEVLNAPTGSWFAHGKNDKYHLKRVRLRKDDGEITLIVLDHHSVVTTLDTAPA